MFRHKLREKRAFGVPPASLVQGRAGLGPKADFHANLSNLSIPSTLNLILNPLLTITLTPARQPQSSAKVWLRASPSTLKGTSRIELTRDLSESENSEPKWRILIRRCVIHRRTRKGIPSELRGQSPGVRFLW